MAHCCVVFCTNNWRRSVAYNEAHAKDLHFHKFPSNLELKKRWIVAIRRDEGPNFKVTDHTSVCSAHFKDDDYKRTFGSSKRRDLKSGVVPSVFPWTKEKPQRKPPKQRIAPSAAAGSASSLTMNDSFDTSYGSAAVAENVDATSGFHSDPAACQHYHDYTVHPVSVEEQLESAKLYIDQCETKIASLSAHKFGIERFSNDPKLIKFYTGFQSYEILSNFYRSIIPYIMSVKNWSQESLIRAGTISSSKSRYLPNAKLHPFDQLFMFLHKIRVGSMDQDLADKFGVSQSTVSRNTITWANLLYTILGAQPLWPSKEQVQYFMPNSFKQLYPNTRVIIDCTELAVQSPCSLVLNSELFSQCKGTTTLKCLVGVTPSGAVSFVSSLYAGSISDKHITKVSGLLDLLEEGDLVMADKGFLIEDLLAEKQCSLVIPHFLKQNSQFTASEAEDNKVIANLRVHVERANRRFKEFHLFDSPIALSLAGSVNQLWAVVCLLTNFQGPLIVHGRHFE